MKNYGTEARDYEKVEKLRLLIQNNLILIFQ